jgi:hypothetical protein
MIKETNLIRLIGVSIVVLMVCCFLPANLQAAISTTGYEFGEVELGTFKATQVNITNLDDAPTTITGFVFAATTCSDFSIGNVPENLTIAPQASLAVEIVYKPSSLGPCSDTLRIYNGTPFASTVTFSGTGIEALPEQPQSLDTSNNPLDQITAAITFMNSEIEAGSLKGTGKGKSADERLKSFKNMLVTAAHMIENGNFTAAREKLDTILRKTDSQPDPPDFVQDGAAKIALAQKIQALIDSLDSI